MEQGDGSPGAGAELQFDQVELTTADSAQACRACKQTIENEYFEIAGNSVCRKCAEQLQGPRGWAPFLRALAFGAGAALLGTIVWFAIIKLMNREFGLLAIGVGLFVGIAVRKGSRGGGGAKYQALAVALTYVSITASYVPLVLTQLRANEANETAEHASKGSASAAAAPPASAEATSSTDADGVTAQVHETTVDSEPAAPGSNPLAALVAILFVFGLAFASPFLGGFDNLLGLLIIGFALYEAWKINRRVPISGPFRLVPAAPTQTPAQATHVLP